MKNFIKILIASLLIIIAAITIGCSSKTDKYVGDWMREYQGLSGTQIEHMTISKQGDKLIVTRSIDGLTPKNNNFSSKEWVWETGMAKANFKTEVKNDVLYIQVYGNAIPLVLDEKGESLSMHSDKYYKKFDTEAVKKKAEVERDRHNAKMQQYKKIYGGKQLNRK